VIVADSVECWKMVKIDVMRLDLLITVAMLCLCEIQARSHKVSSLMKQITQLNIFYLIANYLFTLTNI
jgi:hypothetical protein